MDAGSVLNALLARHNAYLNDTNPECVLRKARRGQDAATPTARPPPKVMEAVRRGVNPLVLSSDSHKAESAARERAKRKRTESVAAAALPALQQRPRKAELKQENRRITGVASDDQKSKRRTERLLPTPRNMDAGREEAVSRTLEARHRELRAQQQDVLEARKRTRSASSTSSAGPASSSVAIIGHNVRRDGGGERQGLCAECNMSSTAPPFSVANSGESKKGCSALSRRAIWRRRCTRRKILRLLRGVTKISMLRRYWYTSLGQAPIRPLPQDDSQHGGADRHVQVSRVTQCTQDALEAKCTARRRRAARLMLLDHLHARVKASEAAATQKAERAAVEDSAKRREKVAPALAEARLTRRQYKSGICNVLQQANAEMWSIAARVVAQRQETMRQLTCGCAAAASAKEDDSGKDGVLPLLLARHFPLFGAVVEVHELELRVPRVNRRRTRQRRRARYAHDKDTKKRDSNGIESGNQFDSNTRAPQLCVLQCHSGVVVEEYSGAVGVLLLPSSDDGVRAWSAVVQLESAARGNEVEVPDATDDAASVKLQALASLASPRVVRVPKHFPGASGAFTELLPLMLAATRHRSSAKPGAAFTRPGSAPSTRLAKTRVMAAVFCGEWDQLGSSDSKAADISAVSPAPNYPLKRLQKRFL